MLFVFPWHCLQGSAEQVVSMKHFREALKSVRPSCLRSSMGRTEVSPVAWEEIGGLDDIKLKLRQVATFKYSVCCSPPNQRNCPSLEVYFPSLSFLAPPHQRASSGQWGTPRPSSAWVCVDPVACCSTDLQDAQRQHSSRLQLVLPTVPFCLSVVLTSTPPMLEIQRRL